MPQASRSVRHAQARGVQLGVSAGCVDVEIALGRVELENAPWVVFISFRPQGQSGMRKLEGSMCQLGGGGCCRDCQQGAST